MTPDSPRLRRLHRKEGHHDHHTQSPLRPRAPTPARRSIVKVVFASLIGTATEWYDFFLFGSAAALVFGEVFFGEIGGTDGTLYAFMTYALGFAARPLGGIVFGHFGDKVGRKKMLVVSLLLMGIGTFAIGLLPTYASIGIAAPLLLIFCRLLQGFAVGGEWGGAVLMAAEHGDDAARGFWTSWPQAGVPLGNLFATGVLWVLAAVQSDAAFLDWGWRIPFLLSAVLVVIGLWVRLTIEESPVFKEAHAERPRRRAHMPIVEVIKEYPREVLIAMGMRMAENISYYIFTVISITYAVDYLGLRQGRDPQGAADRRGDPVRGGARDRRPLRPGRPAAALPRRRRRRRGRGRSSSSTCSTPAARRRSCSRVVVGLLLHSLMYAPQAAFFSELFGTSVRYTGASVGYQLASIFAGALAPIIALKLLGDVDDGNTTRSASTSRSPR